MRMRALPGLLGMLLLLLASPAAAAETPEVTVAQDVYVRAAAGAFDPYVSVEVVLERCSGEVARRLGRTGTTGQGGVVYRLRVPSGTEPGCYRVRFSRGADTATAPVRVRAPQVVLPGGSLTVSVPGDGRFVGRPLLQVVLETCAEDRVAELGRVVAEEDTSASVRVTVPRRTEPGCHQVRFISAVTSAFTRIAVVRPEAPTVLPTTGSVTTATAGAGAALLATGLVLLVAGRRRTAP